MSSRGDMKHVSHISSLVPRLSSLACTMTSDCGQISHTCAGWYIEPGNEATLLAKLVI